MSIVTISIEDFRSRLNVAPRPVVIDVRTPEEVAESAIAGARSVPLEEFDPARLHALGILPEHGFVHLVCRSGRRAEVAARTLVPGPLRVVVVAGGMQAWLAAGYPVVRRGPVRPAALGLLRALGAALTRLRPGLRR